MGTVILPETKLLFVQIMESDAGIMTVRNFRGRCVEIRRKATIRRSVEPIKETKLLELMYIGCMKWYTVEDRMCLY